MTTTPATVTAKSGTATLNGGPLADVTIRVSRGDVERGVILLPGSRGRYVTVDGDWCWETDHAR